MQILKVVEKRGITLEGSIPKRQLMKAFGACQWWLSREWLEKKPIKHPMQSLWQTEGWASDVELFLIGNTIINLRKQGTKKETFEAKRKEFLGKQSANYLGYLFELLVSSLFIEGGNKVELLPPSAEGYDIDVFTPNNIHIQVSCKVCQPSKKYKSFVDAASELKRNFIKASQVLNIRGVFCMAEFLELPPEIPNIQETIEHLRVSVFEPKIFHKQDIRLIYGKSPLPEFAIGFSRNSLSYSFSTVCPIDKKYELERIKSIINKANNKFKKYTAKDKKNLTVIRLPQYISIESAKKYIEAEFNKGMYKSASAVLFVQTHIVNDVMCKNNTKVGINTAVQFLINPHSISPWPTNLTLNLVQALGTVSTTSPPIMIMDRIIKDDFYVYTDYVESIVVPIGSSVGAAGVAGVRRIIEWEGTGWGMELFSIPNEFQLL